LFFFQSFLIISLIILIKLILGEKNQGTLDITNSFALPFEEDPKEPGIWFVDHFYFE